MTAEQEAKEREMLIAEAKEWLGTPYHTMGRVKQGGCDCGTFLLQVVENVGFLPHIEIPFYPEDIACHCAEPKYLLEIEKHCNLLDENEPKKPGDILVFWFNGAKVPHHAAFIVDDEYMIHSYTRQGVIYSNRRGYRFAYFATYRLKRWCE